MNANSYEVRSTLIVVLAVLSPYLVGFKYPCSDSSWTEIGVGFGAGSYADVTRDCSGNVVSVRNVPFQEAAASVDHYTPAIHVGLRTGIISAEAAHRVFSVEQKLEYRDGVWITDPMTSLFYASPLAGVNTDYFGLDAGYVLPFRSGSLHTRGLPAGSLRIGKVDAFHFRLRLADDVPLLTGGPGVMNLGFGFNLGKPNHLLWLGAGAGLYDRTVFGAQFEFPLSSRTDVRLTGTIGGSATTETGFSVRTRVRL